jgi:hypothetical protein
MKSGNWGIMARVWLEKGANCRKYKLGRQKEIFGKMVWD